MKKKIVICFFGVICRSIKYTYTSIERNLINVLKEKYEVDIYVFNLNTQNTPVDRRILNSEHMKVINHTHFEEKLQSELDVEINEIRKTTKFKIRYYRPETVQNAVRQMYSEERVGLFLDENKDKYDCAVVCGPDYYLINKINLNDIENVMKEEKLIYTTRVNPARGYTNGFYIGKPSDMSLILKRYSIINKLLPTHSDYENILKVVFNMHGIKNAFTDMLFVKIRSTKQIARQGIMRKPRFDNTINEIKKTISRI